MVERPGRTIPRPWFARRKAGSLAPSSTTAMVWATVRLSNFWRQVFREGRRLPRNWVTESSKANLSLVRTSCHFGRLILRRRVTRPSVIRSRGGDGLLCSAIWWRDILWREPYPSDHALEFLYKIAPVSALVSGGRRNHLYNPQISTGSAGTAWNSGRNFSVQLQSAGRGWVSLLYAF